MTWTVDALPDLTGRTFVVTGANSGLGLETVLALTRRGGSVILACRNPAKADGALARVRGATPDARVEALPLDLASLASVRTFANLLADRAIDVLVNNAGVMALPRQLTGDGFEMQLATNHLGHFALTALLWPRLRDRAGARVVNVASIAHRMGRMHWDDLSGERAYERWDRYGQTKLANLLFTFELARRAHRAHRAAIALAAHPGYSDTNLQVVTGQSYAMAWLMEPMMRLGNALLAQPASQGAEPQIHAAAAADVTNGDYWGPDGFREFWGHPTRVDCRKAAKNEADQARLWDVSEQLTGIRFEV
jgi:NAD(P)-dependent dehydrogenase (short-subunit alcohol dehydrogenase family)